MENKQQNHIKMGKQTSVEWLIEQCFPIMQNTPPLKEIIEQAKEMHKQEIEEAVTFGDCRGRITTYLTNEQYYNETYQSVDTNEMIDVSQQNDVREDDVENHVPDVRKMVENTENLATEWLEKNFYTYAESRGLDNDQWLIEEEDLDKLFEQAKQMELKAKENTYTEEQVKEQALLLRWLLKHYSTHITEDGLFCYVDSMGKEVDIKDILEHYNSIT